MSHTSGAHHDQAVRGVVRIREEIRNGVSSRPSSSRLLLQPWLRTFNIDTISRLTSFSHWASRAGADTRNRGEAAVLTAAQELSAIALIDDRDAVKVGRHYGVDVHGTVWLLACGVKQGALSRIEAEVHIDALRKAGMRLPCTGATFLKFAAERGLR